MLWYIQESQWGGLVYWWYPHKINRASCIQNTQRTDIILCAKYEQEIDGAYTLTILFTLRPQNGMPVDIRIRQMFTSFLSFNVRR